MSQVAFNSLYDPALDAAGNRRSTPVFGGEYTPAPPGGRSVILGLGNLLWGDEGFGIHAMRALHHTLEETPGLEWVDGGVLGMNLLPLVEECSHLLVLDCIDAGQPAGTVIEMEKEQIPLYYGIKMSEHQVSFQEVLGIASFRGGLPGVMRLVGVQPLDFSMRIGLSSPLSLALPEALRRARAELQRWPISIAR